MARELAQGIGTAARAGADARGGAVENVHYGITFTKREEIEAAWPHILGVRAKGAPVRLVRGPNFFLGGATAGVVIHCPPADAAGHVGDAQSIELVVDGAIVDLNRLPLPADTPIADERFKDVKGK